MYQRYGTINSHPCADLFSVANRAPPAMYDIPEGHRATPGNELGIFEDLGDVFAQEDLNDFFTLLYP